MKKKFIYIITTIYLENPDDDTNQRIKYYSSVGYFFSLKEAQKVVKNNWGDLDEAGYYNFIVIEKVEQGLYPSLGNIDGKTRYEWWYKLTERIPDRSGNWTPCEKPKVLNNVCGFSLG